jgi:hypothetical protein
MQGLKHDTPTFFLYKKLKTVLKKGRERKKPQPFTDTHSIRIKFCLKSNVLVLSMTTRDPPKYKPNIVAVVKDSFTFQAARRYGATAF